MDLWTWERTIKALELLPALHYVRDFHVTQAGIMAMGAFGGVKDMRVHDVMHPASLPANVREQRGGSIWRAAVLESAPAEHSLRLAVKLGLVSQDVFAALTC